MPITSIAARKRGKERRLKGIREYGRGAYRGGKEKTNQTGKNLWGKKPTAAGDIHVVRKKKESGVGVQAKTVSCLLKGL